jgi:hypothetical protein
MDANIDHHGVRFLFLRSTLIEWNLMYKVLNL